MGPCGGKFGVQSLRDHKVTSCLSDHPSDSPSFRTLGCKQLQPAGDQRVDNETGPLQGARE